MVVGVCKKASALSVVCEKFVFSELELTTVLWVLVSFSDVVREVICHCFFYMFDVCFFACILAYWLLVLGLTFVDSSIYLDLKNTALLISTTARYISSLLSAVRIFC